MILDFLSAILSKRIPLDIKEQMAIPLFLSSPLFPLYKLKDKLKRYIGVKKTTPISGV